MQFKATIQIMPRQEILDPQGKATLLGLHNLEFENFNQVRVGKRIELHLEAENQEAAEGQVKEACQKLLVNTIIEQYEFSVESI